MCGPVTVNLNGFVASALAREHASGRSRLPWPSGPTTSSWTYIFVMEGDAYGFRPGLSLMAFLGSVRDIRQQRVEFDLSTMACPFEVELQYRQPYLPNLVGEVGQYNPSRQPFLSWLAAADLDLPGRALDSVYGDKLRLLVPCLNINLKPSSKE